MPRRDEVQPLRGGQIERIADRRRRRVERRIHLDLAQQLRDFGCQSICIKDMAALLKPQPAFDLVKGIKEKCGADTLVHVHVHSTTGVTATLGVTIRHTRQRLTRAEVEAMHSGEPR